MEENTNATLKKPKKKSNKLNKQIKTSHKNLEPMYLKKSIIASIKCQ